MSVNLGDIDLNSDVVSVEANSNLVADDTVIEPSSDFRADEIRVSGEGMEEGGGILKLSDTGKVEMEIRDGGEAGTELVVKDFDGLVGEEAVNGVGLDLGLKGVEAVDRSVQGGFVGEEKEEVKGEASQRKKEGESCMIRLVVDLNEGRVADGIREFDNREEFKEIEVNKLSRDPGVLTDGLVEKALNGVENGNQNATFIEQGTGIKQFEYENKGNINGAVFEQDSCTKKEGEYCVSDLVWGKVRSHPWWPGQIYDTSAASKKALKYKKKDCFLIAYFGDQTFAWNDASSIKPFRMHFSQMEKQSNMDSFTHALNCALEEVSRRLEYGLACSCLSEEVYTEFKSQITFNAGIRKESRVRVGGDNFSTASSFVTPELVHYVKDLAQDPFGVTDRLEFVTIRAQLLAFYRWKGYTHLPTFTIFDGLLENDDHVPVFGEERGPDGLLDYADLDSKVNEQVSSGNRISAIQNGSSRKRKQISGDGVSPIKKEKCMSELMSARCSNGEDVSDEKADKKMNSSSSGKKRNAADLIAMGLRGKIRKSHLSTGNANNMSSSSEKIFKVGDRICRVANQLSGSASNHRYGDNTSQKTVDKKGVNLASASHGVSCSSPEKAPRINIPTEYPPSKEMLSQLLLVARDPMKGYSFLISVVSFFSDFRNSVCLENSDSGKGSELTSKSSDEHIRKSSSNADTMETFGFEGVEDSYWTDRMIQGYSEEQVLFEPESEKEMPTVEPEAAIHATTKSDYMMEPSNLNLESQAEKTVGHTDEKLKEYSPTVLILNFTDIESVPLEANLNQIFSRYGPLHESDTEVLKKSNRAKVVFKRRSDAETAFSSAGKFSIFGPSLVSYRLNYSPSPRKPSTPGTKRNKKDATSVEGKEL